MANTNEELIKQMYGANLESQKQQLTQSHNAGNSALDEAKKQNQAAADANLNRTAVEAQKKAMADAEIQNAYGLSSGTAAQVRLARDNQTAADMAAIRTAQQEADAQVERERALLSQEYTSAIQKAQADNDLELAKALYENAQAEEQKLRAKQEAAAKELAAVGDFALLGQVYGLSDEEVGKLSGAFQASQQADAYEKELEAAKYFAEQTNDYSALDELYARHLGGVYREKVSTKYYNDLLSEINSGYSAVKVSGWTDDILALVEKGLMTEDHAEKLMDKLDTLGETGGGVVPYVVGQGVAAAGNSRGDLFGNRYERVPGTRSGWITK